MALIRVKDRVHVVLDVPIDLPNLELLDRKIARRKILGFVALRMPGETVRLEYATITGKLSLEMLWRADWTLDMLEAYSRELGRQIDTFVGSLDLRAERVARDDARAPLDAILSPPRAEAL